VLIKDPPVPITDQLLMLGTNEYPLYLLHGEREAALFEAGPGAMGPLLGEQMRQLGISTDLLKQVVIPHAHPDHVMAIPLFREMFPGITVAASEAAAKTLSMEKALAYFCQVDDALTSSLLKTGIIGEGHRPKPLAGKRIGVDRLIAEGDTITVEGITLNVLETPGHSECSLSFHEPGAGILLISDAAPYYLPEHDCWWPDYFAGYGAYLRSLTRLAGLGAGILCLGHQGAIKGAGDVESYFSNVMAATQRYHQRILDETKAGRSVRQIAEQLGSEVYEKSRLLPLEFFQKNCGLLVKQSLRHEGISPEQGEG
jgi:glyoxylase-like metal-dependent hydrolase (beta-lactamase superfamily II)